MKNKLISQKTRSRASKVILALFLCTIMISSLCSFTVGETFTFPETPPDYDYNTYQPASDDQNVDELYNSIMSDGHIMVSVVEGRPVTFSVPFYVEGNSGLYVLLHDLNDIYTLKLLSDYAGSSGILEGFTNNDYTYNYLLALGYNPTPTESLTNVWDGILNWITTSISSLQNVFWQEGTVIDFNSDVDTSDAITYNDIVFYKSNIAYVDFNDGYLMLNGVENYDAPETNVELVNNIALEIFTVDDNVLFGILNDGVTVYTNVDVDYYLVDSSGGGLTLLGTLCCIAVAISVVFLLIGTIVNFLKLRS